MYCVQVDPVSNQYIIMAASQPPAIDPATCGMVVLTGTEASAVVSSSAPVDAGTAGAYWGFALFFTLSVWLFAKYGGMVLAPLRR